MPESPVPPDQLVEELLCRYEPDFGRDALAYGNHVRRVFGLVRAQGPSLSGDELRQVAVAAVFHDIAIWVDGTFDYLEPSRDHAAAYLRESDRAGWVEPVSAMIMDHHKQRPVKGSPLVEAFRRADLCDVSLGLIQRGIPRGEYSHLRKKHPVAGFQLRLLQFGAAWGVKHPLRPLPMLRW